MATENELPGKNARAMLPLLEELAEKDAEIERLRASLVEVLEVSSHLMSASAYERARRLLVPNARNEGPAL